jgi:hypothetical protein
MSADCCETQYGFRWGVTDVIRYAEIGDGSIAIGIEVNGKRRATVYVSPTGRSVRVFAPGKGELKAKGGAA